MIRVDAAAGAVTDGARRWPLRLDCRTGGGVVTLDGRDVAVAPLAWRHKQRLARWAHLGPEFVAAQRAALAVDPTESLDDTELTVVAAVAQFLDGPSLPLASELLAAVTVEACRATGLAPAAFDDRDAIDVELIARAGPAAPIAAGSPVAAPEPSSADPWSDATSIRIVTDPPSAAPPTPNPAHEPAAAGPADPAPTDRPPLTLAPTPAPDPTPATAETGRSSAAPLATEPSTPVEHGPALTVRRQRREAPRYRIAPVAPRGDVSPSPPTSAVPPQSPPDPFAGDPPPAEPTLAAPEHVAAAVATGPLIPAASPLPTTSSRSPAIADVAATPWSLPAPVVDGGDDDGLDALADAVAARLAEQLAAQADDLDLGGVEI